MNMNPALKNLILISLDSVRREALGCYDLRFPFRLTRGLRARTPHIDRIARDGVLFRQAICQAPFTPASHASMFTGLNPVRHGIRGMIGHKLTPGIPTLASLLRQQGFRTGAFIGAHALGSPYGLDRGFDIYDEHFRQPTGTCWEVGHRRSGREVTERALEWVQEVDGRFFLFLHYFDAHDARGATAAGDRNPHRRRRHRERLKSFDARLGRPLARLHQGYGNFKARRVYGIRYHLRQMMAIDAWIGSVLECLDAAGRYEETAIVVMADHGDAFGEHGEMNHREFLYDTTLRIPLIIKGVPGLSPESAAGICRSTDLVPTICGAVGITAPPVDGVDLTNVEAADPLRVATACSETRCGVDPGDRHPRPTRLTSIRTGEWKLIIDHLTGDRELYDLGADPGERRNRIHRRMELADRLQHDLEMLAGDAPDTDPEAMTPAEREIVEQRLRSLGYL